MCRLLETVRIENGRPLHLAWHEQRMRRALAEMKVTADIPHPEELIRVPEEFSRGLVRCNILYGTRQPEVSFARYVKKPIRSLKLVACDRIDYHLKYADRSKLAELLDLRGDCDEILIVRHGLITDTSMSNILFIDGNRWVTPSDPLLKGTCRERLLSEGRIVERMITPGDISRYDGCMLINAMRDPVPEERIPSARIFHQNG